MTTSLPYTRPALASKRLTVVRCKFCNKPQFEVQGPTLARFKCNDRGCRLAQEVQIG